MKGSNLQALVIKLLDSKNVYNFKVMTANRKGIHDIIGCINGQFCTFEIKGDGDRPSKAQIKEQGKIIASGGYSMIITNIKMVEDFLSQFEN